MLKKVMYVLFVIIQTNLFASEHGIYLKTNSNIELDIDKVKNEIKSLISNSDFKLLTGLDIAVPDIVREDLNEHCKFRAKLLVLSAPGYSSFLTGFGNKYLIAGFLRIGIYETEKGVQVAIADPETINRITFNDLWENGLESQYEKVVNETKIWKNKLITMLHTLKSGNKVREMMEPVRSDEDLRESSKDMFMMVGPMTLFTDEDQLPEIYRKENKNGKKGIQELKKKLQSNLSNFQPLQEDIEYRLTSSPSVLKWRLVSEIASPDSNTLLLGLTRPRTEGLSFHIAGSSRETEQNHCPGIDHAAAYPIEVLIIQESTDMVIYTPRQMFRMDMYFWDAGMGAFMNHMSMPSILDESIKKALLGNEYVPD